MQDFDAILSTRAQQNVERDLERYQREAVERNLQVTVPQSTGVQTHEESQALEAVADLASRVTAIEQEMKHIRSLKSEFIHVQTAPIHTLGSTHWELKETLYIAIEQRNENHFVACLYDVDLYGYGETIPDAIDALKEMIVDQFEYLSERQNTVRLGSMPKKQIEFLKRVLVSIDA